MHGYQLILVSAYIDYTILHMNPAFWSEVNNFAFDRCLVEGCESPNNATYNAPFLPYSTPSDEDYTWSRCQMYQRSSAGGCGEEDFLTNQTVPCQHWVYDTSVMESTVVSQVGTYNI